MRTHLRFVSPDERVVYESNQHPAVLLAWGLAAFGSLVAAVVLGIALSPVSGSTWLDVLLGLVAIAATLRLGFAALRWRATRVVVTGTRVLRIVGPLKRDVTWVPLQSVTSVTNERSMVGSMLGYGDVVLNAQHRPQLRLESVTDPDALHRLITVMARSGVGGVLEEQMPAPTTPDQADTGPIPRVVL